MLEVVLIENLEQRAVENRLADFFMGSVSLSVTRYFVALTFRATVAMSPCAV